MPVFLAAYPTPGPSFYSRVFHPEFNVDADEAGLMGRRFQFYVRSAGERILRLRSTFTQVREAGAGGSNDRKLWRKAFDNGSFQKGLATASRAFSYSILALITSASPILEDLHINNLHSHSSDSPDESFSGDVGKSWAPPNGAWCWRDDCSGKYISIPFYPTYIICAHGRSNSQSV